MNNDVHVIISLFNYGSRGGLIENLIRCHIRHIHIFD